MAKKANQFGIDFNALFEEWKSILMNPKKAVPQAIRGKDDIADGVRSIGVAGAIGGLVAGILGVIMIASLGLPLGGFVITMPIFGIIGGAIGGAIYGIIGGIIYYIIGALFGGKGDMGKFIGKFCIAAAPVTLLLFAVLLVSMLAATSMGAMSWGFGFGFNAGAFPTLLTLLGIAISAYTIYVLAPLMKEFFGFDDNMALISAAILPGLCILGLMTGASFGGASNYGAYSNIQHGCYRGMCG